MTRFLYTATYIFLCLPYVFFLGSWLRAPFALACLVFLVWCSGVAIRSVYRDIGTSDHNGAAACGALGVLVVLAPVIVVMCFSGVGGWGFQESDWLRGNAVFRDLVDKPWPVIYQTDSGPLVLVYYCAFYLPAAWIGKIAGWQAANHALFVYGVLGLTLAALWVVRVAGVRRWWAVLLFLAFSGMDVVGMAIRFAAETATGAGNQSWYSLEWWAGYGVFAFPSHMDILTQTINQAIPGWLVTALVLNDAREKRLPRTGIFYLGVITLWAPYVAIGLLPFVVVLGLPELSRRRLFATLASFPNALGVLLGLVSAGYYSMRAWPYSLPFDVSQLYREQFTLTPFRLGPMFVGIYPLFVLLEFGILHALLYSYARLRGGSTLLDTPLKRLLVTSTVVLAILPWMNGSWNNDIVLRACLPMLFVTTVVVVRVLDDDLGTAGGRLHQLKRAIVLVVAVGGLNGAWIFSKQVLGTYERGALVAVPDTARALSLFELQEHRYNEIGYNFAGQYLGSPVSPFARHVMAPTPNPLDDR